MSVSQFPNVTEQKGDEVIDLIEQLIGTAKTHPIVENELAIIIAAHMCSAAETILTSQTLQQHCPYDPALVKQVKYLLDSCR